MINTQQYVRKPLFVEAVRLSTANFEDVAAWCQGEILEDESHASKKPKQYIKVRVHNPKNPRQTKAFVGDWLLYTERGYKVYTNKAFHASFDIVQTPVTPAHPLQGGQPSPAEPTKITEATLHSVSAVPEAPSQETGVQPILEVDKMPAQPGLQRAALDGGYPIDPVEKVLEPTDAVESIQAKDQTLAAAAGDSLAMKEAKELIEAEGGTVELATPEAIADVVAEQTPVVPVSETAAVADSPTAPPAQSDGKRVLSLDEQRRMTQDEVRELLQTGEVVLAQDLVS